ncbi:MAG: hypothetical protein IKR05_12980 [Prevotella sp.]|nr:hypothetical protein [Prevotella sp.]
MRTASCAGDLADDLADGYPDDYTWSAHPECNIPAPQGLFFIHNSASI